MRASDIMTRDVIWVSPQTPVPEAIGLLSLYNITSAPVLDADGEVVGIVSELDLLKGRMPHDPRSSMRARPDGPDPARVVEEVMNEPVLCLPDTTDTADLAEVLVSNNVRAVPILRGHELVGIVSRRDVLRTVLRSDSSIRAEVCQRLAAFASSATPATRSWQVEVADGIVTVCGSFLDARETRAVIALARTVPGVLRVHTGSQPAPAEDGAAPALA